jgi:nitrate/nitrite-specific signal transduction histidine kinase
MKIRKQLSISALTIIAVTVLVAASAVTMLLVSEKENQSSEITNRLMVNMLELNIVSRDYLQGHTKRAEEQWSAKYNSTIRLAKDRDLDSLSERESLDQIVKTLSEIDLLFQEIASGENTPEYEQRLGNNLVVKSQGVTTDVLKIADSLRLTASSDVRSNLRNLMVLLLVQMIIVLMVFFKLSRNISGSIKTLTKGAEIIGKGGLDHKIEIKSKDEIGWLAEAFNKMTTDLKSHRGEMGKKNKELEASIKFSEEQKEALEKLNKAMVGRELKMIELKDKTKKTKSKTD